VGKTILSNQIAYHHARAGGRVVYVTLLAETHGRMLGYLQPMGFFDGQLVGSRLHYVNGFTSMTSEGLGGLLQLLRRVVRDCQADLMIIDGMITASALAPSATDYKRFINELQTWVDMVGCTVIMTTGAEANQAVLPEHSMVDGIIELWTERSGARTTRQLAVRKFRGSGFVEGNHTYVIGAGGLVVYPRLEGSWQPDAYDGADGGRLSTGVPRLDDLLTGGVRHGSTTLLLGPSGSGKTILGLHFLGAGLQANQNCAYFGFYENKSDLLRKADRLGFEFGRHAHEGRLAVRWQPAAERVLDILATEILDLVQSGGIRRLFIDGLVGFREAASPERLSGFLAILNEELRRRGVTTYLSEETRALFASSIEVPTSGVSAIFHNMIFLRRLEFQASMLRLLAVMKTRDSAHDRSLYRFVITEHGIELGTPFGDDETILSTVLERAKVTAVREPASGSSGRRARRTGRAPAANRRSRRGA
jgi:circadian clock protein KaiC